MKRIAICAVAALALTGFASIASAGESKVVVSYGDLDLSKEAGRQVLISRLDFAASRICGPESYHEDLDHRAAYQACIKDVMGHTMASLPVAVAIRLKNEPVREATSR